MKHSNCNNDITDKYCKTQKPQMSKSIVKHCCWIMSIVVILLTSVSFSTNQPNINKSQIENTIKEIHRNSSKGGTYDALQKYFIDTISPYQHIGQSKVSINISGEIRNYVERFTKYEISEPYNIKYDNSSFPLIVECDVDVTWKTKKGSTKCRTYRKTYYFTSEYKVAGYLDNEYTFIPNTDWEKYHLKGKVKELHIKNYNANRTSSGKLIKTTLKDSCTIYFTEAGLISEQTDWSDTHIIKKIFSYSNNVHTINKYDNDTYIGKEITTYTEWGEPERELWFNEKGEEIAKEEWIYNDKKQIEKTSGQNKSSSYYTDSYEYNNQGLITKHISHDDEGGDHVLYRKYDEKGRITYFEAFSVNDGIGVGYTYIYNKEGFYDMELNMFTHSFSPWDTIKYSYTYDKIGNYTIQNATKIVQEWDTNYENEISVYTGTIQERTIIYY